MKSYYEVQPYGAPFFNAPEISASLLPSLNRSQVRRSQRQQSEGRDQRQFERDAQIDKRFKNLKSEIGVS